MNRQFTVGVQLKLIDTLSQAASRSLTSFSRTASRAAGETARATRDSARAQRSEWQRLAQAREMLGIRSERAIQREIRQTEAAYRRLIQSGNLTWREQARAAEAMRRKLAELRGEMGRLTASQAGRIALNIGAGALAAGAVVAPGVRRAMSYDLLLAQMANTAFPELDVAGRRRGMSRLNEAIREALRRGGGDRELAAGTLDALIASGAYSADDAIAMLPWLLRGATASAADPTDLAQIGIRATQTFRIAAKDIQRALDMALAGGQAGGFELRDMARWLPQQMAAATMAGFSGLEGFAKLVAANQAVAITAGSKDEAGNNLVNLLAKLTSRETAMSAERLGINWQQRMVRDRERGIDALDSFVGMVDEMVGSRRAWKQLQERLQAAGSESDRRAVYESMAQMVQGSAIGQIIQDRQAIMALIALMNNREYLRSVHQQVLTSQGATERNFALIASTPAFRTQQLANERLFAEQQLYDNLTPAIGSVSDVLTEYARAYPGLTTAIVGATTALTALAAAAGAAGLATLATGGGKAGAIAMGKRVLGMGARLAGRGIPIAGAAMTGWEIGSAINEHFIAGTTVGDAIGESVARVLAIFGNEEALAAIAAMERAREMEVGGEIVVRVEDSRVSVSATSRNRNVPLNVDAGLTMVPN